MSIWHEYLDVMSNPGHFLAEGTFALLEFIIASIIWARIIKPAWKKMISHEHTKIDKEHGFHHKDSHNE